MSLQTIHRSPRRHKTEILARTDAFISSSSSSDFSINLLSPRRYEGELFNTNMLCLHESMMELSDSSDITNTSVHKVGILSGPPVFIDSSLSNLFDRIREFIENRVNEEELIVFIKHSYVPLNLKRPSLRVIPLVNKICPIGQTNYNSKFQNSKLAPGLKLDIYSADFTTIGHLFCAIDSISLVEFLLTEMEFPIDLADSSDSTMLMQCVYHGQNDIVALLLFHGADPFLQDDMGRNIIQIAAMTRRIDMIYYLLPRIVGLDSLLTHIDSFGKSVFDYVNTATARDIMRKYSI